MSIKRFFRWYYFIPIALVGIPLFLALVGEVVMLLWNGLLPPLFGWPRITLWQGLGLLVLCRILFGGLGSGGGGGNHSKRMTPEQRERFRRRMRERFCGPPGESQETKMSPDIS
jgi:hypothetical protein